MAFNYSGDPSDSDLDLVRFLLQDTDSTDVLLQDAEITALITIQGSAQKAAAQGAEVIAAGLGRKIDRTSLSLTASPGRTAEFFLDLAQRLRSEANRHLEVFAGGRSKDGKRTLEQDSDAVQPFAKIGADDHPGSRDVLSTGVIFTGTS